MLPAESLAGRIRRIHCQLTERVQEADARTTIARLEPGPAGSLDRADAPPDALADEQSGHGEGSSLDEVLGLVRRTNQALDEAHRQIGEGLVGSTG